MLRFIKRRLAIRSYVLRLSEELFRRFGRKRYYTVEEVTQVAERAGFKIAFLAYAHAIFCSRKDFEAYYAPLKVNCTYEGLREIVSRRYFGRAREFDAASIVGLVQKQGASGTFYESGAGIPGAFIH